MQEKIRKQSLRVFDRPHSPHGFKEFEPSAGGQNAENVLIVCLDCCLGCGCIRADRRESINREYIAFILRNFDKARIEQGSKCINIKIWCNVFIDEQDKIFRTVDIQNARLIVSVREFKRFDKYFDSLYKGFAGIGIPRGNLAHIRRRQYRAFGGIRYCVINDLAHSDIFINASPQIHRLHFRGPEAIQVFPR